MKTAIKNWLPSILLLLGGAAAFGAVIPVLAPDAPYDARSYQLTATVAANALTIALKNSAGNTPTALAPAQISFRNSTVATASNYIVLKITTAQSIVIPSGASLGAISGATEKIYEYAQYNGTTFGLCASTGNQFDESQTQSSTAVTSGSTTRGTLYCTTSQSPTAVRQLGNLTSTQTNSTLWASAPTVHSTLLGNKSGVISSTSNLPQRVIRATFGGISVDSSGSACTSSPCTIWHQSGEFSTITRTSAGIYTANITSGMFSAIPSCTVSSGNCSSNCIAILGTAPPTTTAVPLASVNLSGTLTDIIGFITCTGPM